MLPLVQEDLGLALLWYAALVASLTFHEASHAWAAARGGDPTAYRLGQVSLDPRPHIRREPMGMVLMPLLSFGMWGYMFGWASTPYDPAWARRYPRRAAWMALAGPAANLALVVGAALCIRAGVLAGVFLPPDHAGFAQVVVAADAGGSWPALATGVSILFTLNLLLCVFNLLPVPPLDGSGALGLLVDEERARELQRFFAQPRFAWLGLLLAWLLVGEFFWAVFRFSLGLLYPGLQYG